MIVLNSRGLVVPSSNIRSTLQELATVFVRNTPTVQRKELFNRYIQYMDALYSIFDDVPFVQWIDGSFTTTVPRPNDIDIVTFVNFDLVDKLNEVLTSFKYPVSLNYGMDAYIVRVFPDNHRLFALYRGDWHYWFDRFSKTERNRRGNSYSKGFIELKHTDEERATLKGLRFDS